MPRRLGQHFLRPASVERLLRVIAPAPRTTCSSRSARARARSRCRSRARAARVVAVELDARLAERLRRARARATSRSSTADALAADLARARAARAAALVGNLPYYVSSPLLRRFLALRGHVRDLHVMLQEEVARRIASPPGSKEYGILSVLYALWADVDLAAALPARLLRAAPEGQLGASCGPGFSTTPRAEVGDLAAFETLPPEGLCPPPKDP